MSSGRILKHGAALSRVAALALGAFAASHEGEFSGYKGTGPGPYHVVLISGHGKTCYLFSEEYERGNAGEQPVLLRCERSALRKRFV